MYDVIIVGSGPTGANAAYPLIQAGLSVAIVDGGLDSNQKVKNTKLKLSKTNSNAFGLLKRSSYVFNTTYNLLKIKSNIEVIQSLAIGGLSEIWHGICDYFSTEELIAIGLKPHQIQNEYAALLSRLPIITRPPLDYHGITIQNNATKSLNSKINIKTLPIMTHYNTKNIIQYFTRQNNFTYHKNQLVTMIADNKSHVTIKTKSIHSNKSYEFKAKYVIMAAGSINTTRILLRSFNLFNYKTTFLTKDSYIVVCLNIKSLFIRRKKKVKNVGQIAFTNIKTKQKKDEYFVQFYKCGPFAIEKGLQYVPLPKNVSKKLLSFLAPFLVIADIRFSTHESNHKFSCLKKIENNQDMLEIVFKEDKKVQKSREKKVKIITRMLTQIFLIPLKTVHSDVTSHYAGGIPFNKRSSRIYSDKNGKLNKSQRIYIADSSTWRTLPASPPTLTMMANAVRVGKVVLEKIKT